MFNTLAHRRDWCCWMPAHCLGTDDPEGMKKQFWSRLPEVREAALRAVDKALAQGVKHHSLEPDDPLTVWITPPDRIEKTMCPVV